MKIETVNLTKTYCKGKSNEVNAVKDVTVKIEQSDFCLITGPSGSGKTTLLSLLALLSHPTRGKIFYEDAEVSTYSDAWQTKVRKEKVGFIFQQYNLLPQFSAWENIALPIICRPISKANRRVKAVEMMRKLGLESRVDFKVSHLSGGEQQRVAIARSLINEPEIIFADEPTASVDDDTATIIIDMFKKFKNEGKTVVISTHDNSLIKEATLHLKLKDGTVL